MICEKSYYTQVVASVMTVITLQRLIMQPHMLVDHDTHSSPVKQTHAIALVVPHTLFQ